MTEMWRRVRRSMRLRLRVRWRDVPGELHRDERGAAMLEYVVIGGGILLVALATVFLVGAAVEGVFQQIVDALTGI